MKDRFIEEKFKSYFDKRIVKDFEIKTHFVFFRVRSNFTFHVPDKFYSYLVFNGLDVNTKRLHLAIRLEDVEKIFGMNPGTLRQ